MLRPAADSDTRAVKAISPGLGTAIDALLSQEGTLVALTNQECLDLVEKTPGSVGFASLAQVLSERRKLRVLSYDGIRPSYESLEQGTYPLFQTFSIVTRSPVSAAQKTFLDFVASSESDRILQRVGSLSLHRKSRI